MNLKKLFFFIPISLLFLVGCEQPTKPPTESKIEHEIWINTEAECCGVKNPLSNLEWLKFMYEDFVSNHIQNLKQPEFIFVFENDTTSENFIVFDRQGEYSGWMAIYDCTGNILDNGTYNYVTKSKTFDNINKSPSIPCFICEEFLNTHTLIDTIAYFIVKP